MNLNMILGVAAFILIAGGAVAILWWRLAAKAAPYKDELEKQRARSAAGQPDQVVVLDAPVKPKSN